KGPADGNGDDQEQRDRAFANRKFGQIEDHHCTAFLVSATTTRSPSRRRWAPSATIRSPAVMPLTSTVSLPSWRTCTARRDTVEAESTPHAPAVWPSS